MSLQVLCLCVALSTKLTSGQYSAFYTHSDFLDLWPQIKSLRKEANANFSHRFQEYLETQLYPNYLTFLDNKERQRQENWGPKDCESVSTARGNQDQYKVVTWSNGKRVPCEGTIDGGRWTIIQRRMNGRIDFDRTWVDYRMGFGDLHGDYWLGLDDMADLTRNGDQELRIDFVYGGINYVHTYFPFRVAPVQENFRLLLGSYRDDIFYSFHNGAVFSTKYNDKTSVKCPFEYNSGWWYTACHRVQLNNVWGETAYAKMLVWNTTTSFREGVEFVTMKIRRRANK
ncbi:ficolin-1 [Aplysia californica]|uniref:Ficolin-1 n=1 Tax=Aplysia californica TaxID=6500 RepID=A0ABM0ZVG7_APLCA|nr:ficolin-1 [Aplysia californica]